MVRLRSRIPFLLLFLLGAVAGRVLVPSGRQAAGGGGEARPGPDAAARLASPSRHHELSRSPADFAGWVAEQEGRLAARSAGAEPLRDRELSGWSLAELRAALAAGLADPAIRGDFGPARNALTALMTEWTRRDPDAAWAWLKSLPPGPAQNHLSYGLSNGWPLERIEEGLELVLADPGIFRVTTNVNYARLLERGIESAAVRGPLAVDELVARARRSGVGYITGLELPADFDFAGLLRAPYIAGEMAQTGRPPAFVADAWLRANPAAAVSGLGALDRQQGHEAGYHLFNGLLNASDDEARQTGAAIALLPRAEQQALFSSGGLKSFYGRPGILHGIIDALPDPAVRAGANLAAASRLLATNQVVDALPFIDGGSTPAERIANLEAQLAARGAVSSGASAPDLELVRRVLVSWQADPVQIERVLTTMNRP